MTVPLYESDVTFELTKKNYFNVPSCNGLLRLDALNLSMQSHLQCDAFNLGKTFLEVTYIVRI